MNYILSLILLASSFYAKSNDFSIIIKEPFNSALVDITQDYDRDISAVGFLKNRKNTSSHKGTTYTNAFDYLSSLSKSYGSKIHLVKVNDKANVILRKTIDLSGFNEAVSILKTPQNGYYIGGYSLEGSSLLIKLDENANKIFEKRFGDKGFDKINKIVMLKDKGVLAIGSSFTSRSQNGDIFKGGLGLSDIFITRFSENGDILWSKKLGTLHDDIGIDAAEADDSSIMVLAQSKNEDKSAVTVMRLTSGGEKIWLKEYKSEKNLTAHRIIKLRDGNFLLSLSQENEVDKRQIKLLKMDLHKNILIDKSINTSYASVLNDIKEYSDGKIIGVGYVQDRYDTDALAMLIDNKLSMLVQEHYGSSEYDAFNAVTILNNSQTAVAGSHTDKDSQESNMWIVKLNRDITMAQGAVEAVDYFNELKEIFKDEINSSQLLVKEDLSIELIDKDLYFEIGKYELSKDQKEFLDKFGVKLLRFLNKIKEHVNTLEISGHTSSEWGDMDFSKSYVNNSELSMKRSFEALSYIFNKQDEKTRRWLSRILKGSGLSFSKKVTLDKKENKERSRRVSFKIILQK